MKRVGSKQPQPRIQSLERGVRLLDVIAAHHPGGIGLSFLAAAANLQRTTTYTLVETLVALGLVTRAADGLSYCLGLRHLEYGRLVQGHFDLSQIAAPALYNLCRATRETVNLAVPYLDCALIIDSLEGSHGIRVTSYAGTRAPYHATACGKAILAYLPEPERARVVAGDLHRQAPGTIASRAKLKTQLATIEQYGYAVDREEMEVGACCVARPIFNGFGQVCGAISVAGTKERMSDAVIRQTAGLIADEIAAVEAALGAPRQPGKRPVTSRRKELA